MTEVVGALSGQAYPQQIESFHERLVLRATLMWAWASSQGSKHRGLRYGQSHCHGRWGVFVRVAPR